MSPRHTVLLGDKIAVKTKPRNTFKNGAVLFSCVCFWEQRNAFLQYLNAQLIWLCLYDGRPIPTAQLTFSWGSQILLFPGCPFLQCYRISKATFSFCDTELFMKPIISHNCPLFSAYFINSNINIIKLIVWKHLSEAVSGCDKESLSKDTIRFTLWLTLCTYCIATH